MEVVAAAARRNGDRAALASQVEEISIGHQLDRRLRQVFAGELQTDLVPNPDFIREAPFACRPAAPDGGPAIPDQTKSWSHTTASHGSAPARPGRFSTLHNLPANTPRAAPSRPPTNSRPFRRS